MHRLFLAIPLAAVLPSGAYAQGGHEGHDHATHETKPKPAAKPASGAKELQPQSTCPITGKPVDKNLYADYEGHRIYFSAKDCAATFAEFPDRWLYEMYAKGQRPENIQTTCPVSGEALENHDTYVDVLNRRIYTCCAKCIEKVKADPAAYLDKLEGRSAQAKCPIRGGPVKREVSVVVQGQKVYFCCPGCEQTFEADADRYFAEFAKNKVVTEPAEMTCPVTGEKVENKQLFLTWQGRRYYFCCEKCLPGFLKDPKKYTAQA